MGLDESLANSSKLTLGSSLLIPTLAVILFLRPHLSPIVSPCPYLSLGHQFPTQWPCAHSPVSLVGSHLLRTELSSTYCSSGSLFAPHCQSLADQGQSFQSWPWVGVPGSDVLLPWRMKMQSTASPYPPSLSTALPHSPGGPRGCAAHSSQGPLPAA